ncbi:MAG TPA: M23 family metallopeptidase [Gemmatimonadaceae bacterium]
MRPLVRRCVRPIAACAMAACALGACARGGSSGENIEESSGVVVRLPVRLDDTLSRASAPRAPAPLPEAPEPANDEGPRMEVPAVPEPLVARVDSALDGVAYLRSRRLMVPVDGVEADALLDSFDDARGDGSRTHGALDIHAPQGTPVLAADDGHVEKLHVSDGGGITLYQVDPSGRFVYYYAHLAGYRDGIAEGDSVRRGEVLGYVGTTGNAPPGVPHLHFAIGRMDAERRWWRFEPIDPLGLFALPGRLGAGATPTS